MAQQTIGIGSAANDGNGDPLRTAFNKANLNFTELYSRASFIISTADDYIGGAGSLDGEITEDQSVPTIYYFKHSSLGWKQYLLRAGTDAESSPGIIRPDDYDVSTNAKVFELMN